MQKITIFTLVCVMWVASAAMGQTTRPATQPALVGVRPEYLKQLQAEVEKLRDEVAALRKENAALKSGKSLPGVVDDKIVAAIKEGRLSVGMTLDQAEGAMRNCKDGKYEEKSLAQESGSRQLYEFKFQDTYIPSGYASRPGYYSKGPVIWAWFEKGKIIEWGK